MQSKYCCLCSEPQWKQYKGVFGRPVSQPVFPTCLLHLLSMLDFKWDASSLGLGFFIPAVGKKDKDLVGKCDLTSSKSCIFLFGKKHLAHQFSSSYSPTFSAFSSTLLLNISWLIQVWPKKRKITTVIVFCISFPAPEPGGEALWADNFSLLPPSCPEVCNKHLPQDFVHSAHERCLVSYTTHMMLSRSAHCDSQEDWSQELHLSCW